MSPGLEALGRRAVACKRWRWMPGMTAIMPDGNRARRLMEGKWWCPPLSNTEAFVYEEETLPDLTDPATLGCLEGLVVEAWGASLMYVEPCGGGFEPIRFEVRNLLGRVADGYPVEAFVRICAPTRVEALVLALEHAPRRVTR